MKGWKKTWMTGVGALVLASALTVTAWAAERLDTVTDTYWDENTVTLAHWDEVDEAYQYEIYLYRDESKVTEKKTTKNHFNFKSFMTKEGDYTFRVRALAKKGSRDYTSSYWSDDSDSCYISEDYAEFLKNGGQIDTDNSGPGAPKKEGWLQDGTGWWYKKADGTYPADQWFQDPADSRWYFFDARGYMKTGWIDWNGSRYYCDAQGSPSGAMVTGEYTVDGVVCRFDESGVLVR